MSAVITKTLLWYTRMCLSKGLMSCEMSITSQSSPGPLRTLRHTLRTFSDRNIPLCGVAPGHQLKVGEVSMHDDSTGVHHKRPPSATQVIISLGICFVLCVNCYEEKIDLLGALFIIYGAHTHFFKLSCSLFTSW